MGQTFRWPFLGVFTQLVPLLFFVYEQTDKRELRKLENKSSSVVALEPRRKLRKATVFGWKSSRFRVNYDDLKDILVLVYGEYDQVF